MSLLSSVSACIFLSSIFLSFPSVHPISRCAIFTIGIIRSFNQIEIQGLTGILRKTTQCNRNLSFPS